MIVPKAITQSVMMVRQLKSSRRGVNMIGLLFVSGVATGHSRITALL
jgi:hypothetical protein